MPGRRSDMTIDTLAQRSGTTARNIRSYQSQGLLPPPTVVGRTGYYDDAHLGRLRLIARLQERGFSLAGIGELLRAWEERRSLGDVLGFEEALTAPWSDEEPETVGFEELLERFPEAGADPALALRAVELGLIEPVGEAFRVPSPSLLGAGAELVAVGVPLAVTQDEVAALRSDMARIAARFVGLFERYVWAPFVEAGMPTDQLGEVTDALRRLRPLAEVAVRATLATAMEEATAASTVAQVGALPVRRSEEVGA
ncbi:MAG: MerR family transcriptional regulator [Actinomycetota bacterium]|jgi:DNA-binding transcriptional MerR regulator|nr:MerR family transcriptional regulator [Actinomycetota bacterium]